jgi:uncharacterized damage-inducible protein DinB
MLEDLRRLAEHDEWADRLILAAIEASAEPPGAAVRELGHTVAAAEVWLSRLEGRPSRTSIWPSLTPAQIGELVDTVHRQLASYLETLDEATHERRIAYTNSAGQAFETPVKDILLHMALHAQYHRGKINLLLRHAGLSPAPTDYIAFVRGVPAATTIDNRRP